MSRGGGRTPSSGGKAAQGFGEEEDDPSDLQPRVPRPGRAAQGNGKASAEAVPAAQEGPLPPEPQAAVRALAATASAASAAPKGAAATAADTEDDEPVVVSVDIAFSRRGVKRMRLSLEIADVQFGAYDKSHVRTLFEHVVLIF